MHPLETAKNRRDFAHVLGYVNYRHFLAVIEKARTTCFNSGNT